NYYFYQPQIKFEGDKLFVNVFIIDGKRKTRETAKATFPIYDLNKPFIINIELDVQEKPGFFIHDFILINIKAEQNELPGFQISPAISTSEIVPMEEEVVTSVQKKQIVAVKEYAWPIFDFSFYNLSDDKLTINYPESKRVYRGRMSALVRAKLSKRVPKPYMEYKPGFDTNTEFLWKDKLYRAQTAIDFTDNKMNVTVEIKNEFPQPLVFKKTFKLKDPKIPFKIIVLIEFKKYQTIEVFIEEI